AQERDTSRSKLTHLTHVEHHGLIPDDEAPNVLADLIDIDGVDFASDGQHRRQVTTVGPNLSATAVHAAVSLPRRDVRDSHEQPHSPWCCVDSTITRKS